MTDKDTNKDVPLNRALRALTMAEDGTPLDDGEIAPLTVGDIRKIVERYDRSLSMIREMSLKMHEKQRSREHARPLSVER